MTGAAQWDAVFLDRDGTITAPAVGRYVVDPDELRLQPGAGDAVRRLNEAGVLALLVTNQQGVATGLLTPEGLLAVHRRLDELLAAQGAHLDGAYVCPHAAGTCTCRKPGDGLVRQALADHPRMVPARCAIVGDALTDVQAGSALGLFRVLLHPSAVAEPASAPPEADAMAPDVEAAVALILGRRAGR